MNRILIILNWIELNITLNYIILYRECMHVLFRSYAHVIQRRFSYIIQILYMIPPHKYTQTYTHTNI